MIFSSTIFTFIGRIHNPNPMIKYQVLVAFLCVVVVVWIGLTLREHRKARGRDEEPVNDIEQ